MLGNSSSHSKSLKTHVSSRGRPSGVRQSHNRVKSRSKIKFVGQSEYRTQFKAWPITVGPSENPLAGKLKKGMYYITNNFFFDVSMLCTAPQRLFLYIHVCVCIV